LPRIAGARARVAHRDHATDAVRSHLREAQVRAPDARHRLNMNDQTNPEIPENTEMGTDPDVVKAESAGEQPALESGSVPHVQRVLEAALLSSPEPLTVMQLKRLFAGEVDADNIRKVLDELKGEWADRTVELTSVASGWRFRVRPEYQRFLDRISN